MAAADAGYLADLSTRYGIHTPHALGVRMPVIKAIAARLRPDHELAHELWATGCYEARLAAGMVDDPAQVTAAQMDAWAADFDNWAIVDSVCFHLFARVPHAWDAVDRWSDAGPEFTRRAAYALWWSLANHDRHSPDDEFRRRLPLAMAAASDGRPLVRKAVTMALTATGKRRSTLVPDVLAAADSLAAGDDRNAANVGRTIRRELAKRR